MRSHTTYIRAGAALLLMYLTAAAQSAPNRKQQLNDAIRAMFGLHAFQQASISPDGRRVVWVESLADPEGVPSAISAIYAKDLNQSPVMRISAGDNKRPHEEHDVTWSPDSKQITFLSDAAEPGQLQLFVKNAIGGQSRQLTHLKGYLSSPAWSPDGQSIALLFTENATRVAGPLVAETPDAGVVGEDVIEQRLTS